VDFVVNDDASFVAFRRGKIEPQRHGGHRDWKRKHNIDPLFSVTSVPLWSILFVLIKQE
jgi:hypothetical protein